VSYFEQLRGKVHELVQQEDGCAWLKEQTFRSIANYSIEEVYELLDAIERNDIEAVKDELSDLCFHLMIYTELPFAGEKIALEDLAKRTLHKLSVRQQSISDVEIHTADASHEQWQLKKHQHKYEQSGSIVADVPMHFPALLQSHKMLQAVEQFGFKFNSVNAAREKLAEEISELDEALVADDSDNVEKELGDVIFACVALARELKLNPDQALRRSNRNFKQRMLKLESICRDEEKDIFTLSSDELLTLYDRAKASVDGS
jgi:MazG family protein